MAEENKVNEDETTLDDAIEALVQIKRELDGLKAAFERHEHKNDGSLVFRGGV